MINCLNNGANLKQMLFDIDMKETQRLKDLRMDEEKMNTAEGHMAAMKFLA